LSLGFRRKREPLLGRTSSQDAGTGIFANGRPMFEAVAGTASDQPYILEFGMAIDQKVAARSVRVLTVVER
jgi:hypothetical protein